MDRELTIMLGLTRKLPPFPHVSGLVNRMVKPLYLRKRREAVVTDVLGVAMELDPSECVDAWLLFCPQLYDRNEIRFLRRNVRPGDTFLDMGANIGYYSLIAGKAVGERGRVIAIEADEYNCRRLARNVRLNRLRNVTTLNVGVSDKREVLRLSVDTAGNRGGNTFLGDGKNGVDVECYTLLDLLRAQSVNAIRCAKLDIEGFEYRVLRRFFEDAPVELYPKFVIVEHNPAFAVKAGGDALELLKGRGYVETAHSGLNWMLEHAAAIHVGGKLRSGALSRKDGRGRRVRRPS